MTHMRRPLTLVLTGALLSCAPPAAPPPPRPPPKPAKPAASATGVATAEPLPEPAPKSVPARRIALDVRGGCAVLEDGGVSCWGGTVGSAPRRLPGIRKAMDVSLGGDLAVVLEDGTVAVFPDRDARTSAITLSLKGVRAISQAVGSACALREGGKVSCWQSGILDQATRAEARASEVRGVSEAVAVAAAGGQACILQKDTKVACWAIGGAQAPKVVPDLANVVDLHVGPHVACVRDTSGTASCFDLQPRPAKPIAIGEASVIGLMEYRGDAPHLCRAREAGILCDRPKEFPASWTAPSLETGEVKDTRGLAIRQLAVANHAACALDDQGIVRCWGLNYIGILGQPDTRLVEKPTVVPDVPKMRAIAASQWFSCALSVEGDVYCAGTSGGASLLAKSAPRSTFQKVPDLPKIERIAASGEYACAFASSGEAWCFEGAPWPGNPRVPIRFSALDGARDVRMPGVAFPDSVVVINGSGELLVGSLAKRRTDPKIKLTTIAKVGPVRRIAVEQGDVVMAQDDKGRVATVWAPEGEPKKPVFHPDLQGALGLNDHALALLPGGKVLSLAIHGQPSNTLSESSPLVTLLDGPAACGTTSAGVLGCWVRGELRTLAEGVQQVAGSSKAQQLILDSQGVLRCRGDNEQGQCGVTIGLFSADAPVEVHIPAAADGELP